MTSATAMGDSARASAYERFRVALKDGALPLALVDLDALEANVRSLLACLPEGSLTIRVATKSIRHPGVLRRIADLGGRRVRGLMTYSANEIDALIKEGWDDFLMGYPVARSADARLLAQGVARGKTVRAMVDAIEQLPILEAAAQQVGVRLPVCLDIDASWRPLGGRAHLGVRRSPLRDGDDVLAVARRIADSRHLVLDGVMAYEAQVAGMPDHVPGSRHLDAIRRLIKDRSRPVVASRRADVVAALRRVGHTIGVVNGGGTGSLPWTARDPSCTEATVGSGFLCSHLFDHFQGVTLAPALFFALPIVRRPSTDYVTCMGGGYIASGPPAPDRAPMVFAPEGLTPLSMEGFGEVQTPFRVHASAPALNLGDPVICRPAKAGELAERFNEYALLRGDRIEAVEPTYRGLGLASG